MSSFRSSFLLVTASKTDECVFQTILTSSVKGSSSGINPPYSKKGTNLQMFKIDQLLNLGFKGPWIAVGTISGCRTGFINYTLLRV